MLWHWMLRHWKALRGIDAVTKAIESERDLKRREEAARGVKRPNELPRINVPHRLRKISD